MPDTAATKALLREAFRPWEAGDSGPFFEMIAEDVTWTVIGTTSVSGVYQSKTELIDKAFGPLMERLGGDLKTRFVNLALEGDRAYLEFTSSGLSKKGVAYEQVYCWAMTLRDGQIVEIIAYLDTDLLVRVFA
ncbi:MAG: nuclear transport factor 2 family protein [Pseudomonadota bacterium]